MTYDPLNRPSKWLVTQQANPSSVVHDYVYQYDGTSNRTQILADPQDGSGQIVADPSQGLAHSNENDLGYTAASTLDQVVAYGAAGTNPSTTTYSYDTAGDQTGNDGGGTGKPLTIGYLPTNQTQSITNTGQEPVAMTWTGPGQGERVGRSWTDGGTAYADHFTYTPLGLAGRTANTPNTPASSQFIRDPYGTPVAERNSDGTEYYSLFDGQGNVVALEDPGTVVGSYDYCPTGNEADLPGGTVLTQASLNNPLRQGAEVYDDDLKDYFGGNGVIGEDYSGVGTQRPGRRYGDVIIPAHMPNAGGGGEACDANSNPEETTADEEGCNVTQDISGENSADAGGGTGGYSPWPGPGGGRQAIGGRTYSQHALDRMVPRGLSFKGNRFGGRGIPPSVVENALQNGQRIAQGAGEAVKYVYENVTVIYNEAENVVVTLWATGP